MGIPATSMKVLSPEKWWVGSWKLLPSLEKMVRYLFRGYVNFRGILSCQLAIHFFKPTSQELEGDFSFQTGRRSDICHLKKNAFKWTIISWPLIQSPNIATVLCATPLPVVTSHHSPLRFWLGETTIFYIKIWNHPIETTIYKWLFGVPSRYPPKFSVFFSPYFSGPRNDKGSPRSSHQNLSTAPQSALLRCHSQKPHPR